MTGRRLARRGLVLGVLAAAWCDPRPAHAGTYLSRAALLLASGARELSYLRARVADKELARLVARLAQARLETAATMTVPKEVVQAHPHLLLVLENHTQAAEAAIRGEPDRFNLYFQRALDEERTFRAVLKQFGWVLPEVS